MESLMPISSPWRLTSGPPLLPGLMAASVCRKSWKWIVPSGRRRSRRPRALMIPKVTELAQPEGTSQGEHEIAGLQPVAVAQGDRNQVGRGNGHHRHVGLGVCQDLRGVDAAGRRPDGF